MKKVRLQTHKDFIFAMEQIDDDVKKGLLSREEAYKSQQKLKIAYGSNEVNRSINEALVDANYLYL